MGNSRFVPWNIPTFISAQPRFEKTAGWNPRETRGIPTAADTTKCLLLRKAVTIKRERGGEQPIFWRRKTMSLLGRCVRPMTSSFVSWEASQLRTSRPNGTKSQQLSTRKLSNKRRRYVYVRVPCVLHCLRNGILLLLSF